MVNFVGNVLTLKNKQSVDTMLQYWIWNVPDLTIKTFSMKNSNNSNVNRNFKMYQIVDVCIVDFGVTAEDDDNDLSSESMIHFQRYYVPHR